VARSQYPISGIHLQRQRPCLDVGRATDVAARRPPTGAGRVKSAPTIPADRQRGAEIDRPSRQTRAVRGIVHCRIAIKPATPEQQDSIPT
jgi:hypothetical protein